MKKFSQGFEWAFRDLLIALVVVYMAFSILAINVTQLKKKTEDSRIGFLTIEMQWPINSKVDVDLWVKPAQDNIIGYPQKTGKYCDLVRDDLGPELDPSSRNVELVVCRQIPAGEWVVNVEAYNEHDDTHKQYPVEVTVVAKMQMKNSAGSKLITEKKVTLTKTGDEQTAFRFTIDSDQNLVDDSINDLFMPLYGSVGQ